MKQPETPPNHTTITGLPMHCHKGVMPAPQAAQSFHLPIRGSSLILPASSAFSSRLGWISALSPKSVGFGASYPYLYYPSTKHPPVCDRTLSGYMAFFLGSTRSSLSPNHQHILPSPREVWNTNNTTAVVSIQNVRVRPPTPKGGGQREGQEEAPTKKKKGGDSGRDRRLYP